MKRFTQVLLVFLLYGWVIPPASSSESADPSLTQTTPSATRAIPFKHEPKKLGDLVGQSLLTLLLVIGIAAGTLYAAKKYLPRLNFETNSVNRLTLIEVLRLTTKTTLFVVRFDNITLLLGQHGDSINVLSTQATDQQSPNPPQA